MNELTMHTREERNFSLLTLKTGGLNTEEISLLYDIYTTAIVDFFQIHGGKFKDIRATACLCAVDFY